MSSPPHATALDPGSEAALRAKYGARHRWLLLVTVMVGVIASIMSSTWSTWRFQTCRKRSS